MAACWPRVGRLLAVLLVASRDISEVESRLNLTKPRGRTAMYDALYLGMEKLRASRNPRKALLLITDGDDNESSYKFSDIRDFVKENDIRIYSVGIVDDEDSELDVGGKERDALEELAAISGVQSFFPHSADELEDICEKIAIELRDEYVLEYKSTNTAKDGKWRSIRVELAGHGQHKVAVRSRAGYYAPSG